MRSWAERSECGEHAAAEVEARPLPQPRRSTPRRRRGASNVGRHDLVFVLSPVLPAVRLTRRVPRRVLGRELELALRMEPQRVLVVGGE